jgi:hypothetical protein
LRLGSIEVAGATDVSSYQFGGDIFLSVSDGSQARVFSWNGTGFSLLQSFTGAGLLG